MVKWDSKAMFAVPDCRKTDAVSAPGVEAVLYDSVKYQGKNTRVFAWIGIPENASAEKPVPGMVLVHGGGATALPRWVRYWNSKGYAAIAMDTCGGMAAQDELDSAWRDNGASWPRHEASGPEGWGKFEQAELPAHEQWMYHAVNAVVRAHSLLRSRPEVDAKRIGITGVSWGGVLTCIAAGLDSRFCAAMPVYGCGFLEHDSGLYDRNQLPEHLRQRWLKLWDPSHYLPLAEMPFLWVDGTNDFAFPLDAVMKSARRVGGESRLSIQVRMEHGHGPVSEEVPVLLDFMNTLLAGQPLPPLGGKPKRHDGRLQVSFPTARQASKVEFNFTRASGFWSDRTWNTVEAEFNPKSGRAQATLPYGTRAAFFNFFDADGLLYSSKLWEA